MDVERQVGESERRAVFFQKGPKESVVVSFACPGLERREVVVVLWASGQNVCARLDSPFGTVGAEGLDVREVFPSIGIIFSNGGVPGEGPSDPGEFLGGVVGHVKEVMLGCLVFDSRSERFTIASDIEPVATPVRGEAGITSHHMNTSLLKFESKVAPP